MRPGGEKTRRRWGIGIPNWISFFRLLLIPVFICVLSSYRPGNEQSRLIATVIFLIAVISDALDGMIARFCDARTTLGALLDPIADKLLLSSGMLTLALVPALPAAMRLPVWVLIVIVSRDVILLIGSVLIYLVHGVFEIIPTGLGKITTFLQMLTVLLLLMMSPLSTAIWHIAVFFTLISGADYIRRGMAILNGAARAEHNTYVAGGNCRSAERR